jgi:hypothetical protein
MNTDRNPYAPPAADVVLNQTNSTTQKKSLLPMWLAALYCIVIGAGHLVMLVQITYRTWDMDDWLPGWAHAVAFVQPLALFTWPLSLLYLADLMVLVLITRYVFALRGRGMLR